MAFVEVEHRHSPITARQEGVRRVPLVVYTGEFTPPSDLSDRIMSEAEHSLNFKPITNGTSSGNGTVTKGELLETLYASIQDPVITAKIVARLQNHSAVDFKSFLLGKDPYIAVLERHAPEQGSGQHYPTYTIHLARTR